MKAVYFGEFHHTSPLLSVRLLTSERSTQIDRYYLGGLDYASPKMNILSFFTHPPFIIVLFGPYSQWGSVLTFNVWTFVQIIQNILSVSHFLGELSL